jgi:uncharacterized membrane protein
MIGDIGSWDRHFVIQNRDIIFPLLLIPLYPIFFFLGVEPIKMVIGLIFFFYVPGAPFIKTLFPSNDINELERVVLILTISTVLIAGIGLILVYSPIGISLTSIFISTTVFTVIFVYIAQKRMKGELRF